MLNVVLKQYPSRRIKQRDIATNTNVRSVMSFKIINFNKKGGLNMKLFSKLFKTKILEEIEKPHESQIKPLKNHSGFDIDVFIEASRSGDNLIVEQQLSMGIDVNISDNEGDTALGEASYYGMVKTVKILLSNQANVEQKIRGSWTALMQASGQGHLEVVKLLLENGANVNTKNSRELTSLMSAASKGNAEIVKLLLDYGATVNDIEKDGSRTALMWACVEGNYDVVKLLLEKGADIRPKDINWNKNALEWALSNNHHKIVTILQEYGA